jgi:protein-disulfide isomerase
MEKDPVKFEAVVRKFYDTMDKLPERKLQFFVPLIQKVNDLVDRYNATLETEKSKSIPMISQEDLKVLESLVTWEMKWSSDIVLLEFSDFECPFCKRHYQNNTLKEVVKAFDGKLSKAYLHFPLRFHPMAEPTAIAAECVKAQLGKDGYYTFIDTVFSSTGALTTTSLETIVKNTRSLDSSKYSTCAADTKTKDTVYAQMDLGDRVFGVQGTPAHVILNLKTREYLLISGAYPAKNIIDEVKKLLK